MFGLLMLIASINFLNLYAFFKDSNSDIFAYASLIMLSYPIIKAQNRYFILASTVTLMIHHFIYRKHLFKITNMILIYIQYRTVYVFFDLNAVFPNYYNLIKEINIFDYKNLKFNLINTVETINKILFGVNLPLNVLYIKSILLFVNFLIYGHSNFHLYYIYIIFYLFSSKINIISTNATIVSIIFYLISSTILFINAEEKFFLFPITIASLLIAIIIPNELNNLSSLTIILFISNYLISLL